jgi:predicted MPP superfamily phosphohydrolase
MNRRAFLTALGAVATSRKFAPLAVQQVTDPTPVAVLRFPYLQNVTNSRASILWATFEFAVGQVRYTSDGINYQTVVATARPFSASANLGLSTDCVLYQADLTGLSPNTDYFYTVSLNGQDVASAGEARFTTAGAGPFKFVVVGDSGWGDFQSDAQGLIANLIAGEKPALVVHTGDLVYNPTGTFDSYQRNYFNYFAAAMCSAPFFPCPGNHEYDVPNAIPYLSVHSLPFENVPLPDRGRYYSFDWGNVHFVSIDAYQSLNRAVNANGPMLRWLDNDLRSTRQFWRIVYFHPPPYAGGVNQGDIQSQWARDYMVPIFERYGVQVVFSGHEHSYQRSLPIWKNNFVTSNTGISYLTSGGGGAPLYSSPTDGMASVPIVAFAKSQFHYLRVEVNGPSMVVHVRRKDGTEIEAYPIGPAPVFSDNPKIVPLTLSPGPVAGATIRIFGRNLAAQETFSCISPPATEMVGTFVTVNGVRISLLYVSPTQIYAQLPFAVSGNITLRITTPNGFIEKSI